MKSSRQFTENELIEYFLSSPFSDLKGLVIGLIGTVGAGKTYFVKRFLRRLKLEFDDEVSSPTFGYCNFYTSSLLRVAHFDLYRVESKVGLYETSVYEALESSEQLTFIEWVNRFPEIRHSCDRIIYIQMIKGKHYYSLEK